MVDLSGLVLVADFSLGFLVVWWVDGRRVSGDWLDRKPDSRERWSFRKKCWSNLGDWANTGLVRFLLSSTRSGF